VLPPLDLRASTVLHAYLANHTDAFPLDDQAWLVVGTPRKSKVLIVTPGNFLLSAVFEQEATRRLAEPRLLDPAELEKESYRQLAHSGELDLVIFDRCAPAEEKDMPHANALFIDRPPPPWRRSNRHLKNIHLEPSKRDHPLLRDLTLRECGAADGFEFQPLTDLPADVRKLVELPEGDARKRRLPPVTRILETGRQIPVLLSMLRGGYTDVVMTFPLLNDQGDLATNWPLQASFPLFWRNVLYRLGNVREAVRRQTVQAGEPITLRVDAAVEWITVAPPGGAANRLERGGRADFVYADTDQVGLYNITRSDRTGMPFAVNLLDAGESDIAPRPTIDIGGDKFVAGQERTQPFELWKWIVVVALLVLLLEWCIYNRRIYV